MKPVSYTVKDFCAVTGLGKTTVYDRIRSGDIRAITLFGRRLIPAEEAQRLVDQAKASSQNPQPDRSCTLKGACITGSPLSY